MTSSESGNTFLAELRFRYIGCYYSRLGVTTLRNLRNWVRDIYWMEYIWTSLLKRGGSGLKVACINITSILTLLFFLPFLAFGS